MGKRSLIVERYNATFRNLWKEAMRDIMRDLVDYLMTCPAVKCIRISNLDRDSIAVYIGEGGNLYVSSSGIGKHLYRPDNNDVNLAVFKGCVNDKIILENVLSEESRVDVKLIIDRYFYSIEHLYVLNGITKLKHIYPYLPYNVAFNLKDAAIKAIQVESDEHFLDENYDSRSLFGEELIKVRKYKITLSYFQNRRKETSTISVKLGLSGISGLI